jgi:hypothetical protein
MIIFITIVIGWVNLLRKILQNKDKTIVMPFIY